ncbi:hypothetical protein LUZ60_016862 [Juncus effusus]|nr:hypothetical protein LUZ60_016862 [Juncus effusus]
MEEPISPSHSTKTRNLQNNFQNKAIFFAIFVVFLPFFASKSPDFVKNTLSNKIWELFHLLLVGIAVSYGLFCRKLAEQESETEISPKHDNTQNYLSEILDRLPFFDSSGTETPNFQAQSYVYNQNEPLIVVENESNNGDSQSCNKPLLLPIRSLKPIINEPELAEGEEFFRKDGDSEAFDSTGGEEKGDYSESYCNFHFKSQSEKFDYNSKLVPSKNEYFHSMSMKETSKDRKISPNNFKLKQKGSNLKERPVITVKSKKNPMDELIKSLEVNSSDESEEVGYGFERNESSNEEETSSCVTEDGNEDNDDNEVDKKADEFIAKFREQIRKQKIQSTKRNL